MGPGGGRHSPAVQPLVALAGAPEPFGRADGLPRRPAGPRLSASTRRRVAEGAGDALRERHSGDPVRAERPAAWDFRLPGREGQSFPGTAAYPGPDAFAVPTRRDGGVDGRMLHVGLL